MCVCVLFPTGSPHILPSMVRGHVAGSRSLSEFGEKGEVTSGFLCADGQVYWCYCGGALDFLPECFVGKRLKLDLRSQGPPVGGNVPLSQSSQHASFIFCLFSSFAHLLPQNLLLWGILRKENINFI